MPLPAARRVLKLATSVVHEDPAMAMRKTLSFAVVHFCVAFSVGWLLTGSALIGGLMALLEPAVNTVAFYFHERAWARWGAGASDMPQGAGTAPVGLSQGLPCLPALPQTGRTPCTPGVPIGRP